MKLCAFGFSRATAGDPVIGDIYIAPAVARPDLRFPTYKDTKGDFDVAIAHCPERILPGQMVKELVTNDRIIGGMTDKCSQAAAELYQSFVRSEMIFPCLS